MRGNPFEKSVDGKCRKALHKGSFGAAFLPRKGAGATLLKKVLMENGVSSDNEKRVSFWCSFFFYKEKGAGQGLYEYGL